MLIGIDLGTSNCKVAAFDEQGRLLAMVRQPVETRTPGPGLVEQEAAAWRQAVVSGLRQLWVQAGLDPARTLGVGLCGHFPSLALLDRRGEPLRPAIIWKDRRGLLPADLPAERLAERVRLPVQYLDTLPLAKLCWLKQHEAACFQALQSGWCLGAKDTIVFYLTGQAATDPVEAWWTGLAGPAGRAWDEALLAQVGLWPGCLPAIQPMTSLAGRVSPAAAGETGLPAGTAVAVGTGDGICGALGAQVLQPGQGVAISGSSLIVVAPVSDNCAFAGDEVVVRCPRALDSHDVLYTSTPCGSAFAFVQALLDEQAFDSIRRQAWQSATRPDDPIFIPHLEGITSPIANPDLRGAWLGLAIGQSWPQLYRAVEEGIAFSARQILEALQQRGVPLDTLRLAGGGARSRAIAQFYADALAQPVTRLAVSEVGCLGAAALAAVAAGVYPDLMSAAGAMVAEAEVVEPATGRTVSAARYARFSQACAWLSAFS